MSLCRYKESSRNESDFRSTFSHHRRAGFVGSTIADQLVAAGASEIRIIDNFVRGSWSNVKLALASGKVKVTEGDIRRRRSS